MSTIRRPMGVDRVRRSNVWSMWRYIILIAAAAAGVLLMIFFGFPLIEDLIKGVDPSLRYQPKVEADFKLEENTLQTGNAMPDELFINDFTDSDGQVYKVRIKNEPFIDGDNIIFTTQFSQQGTLALDTVMIYNTQTHELKKLPNVEKKYDRLLSPMLSGDYAVWVDCYNNGGGRIVGYDLKAEQQFLIKEFVYAQPQISIAGNVIAFMQWAGETTQRLYVYDLATREAATVKLYEDTAQGNSAASISENDLVWAEYGADGKGTLKRIDFSGGAAKFDSYNFGDAVYEPKTNGRDIVFATEKDIISGSLMLSTNGSAPVKIAENVVNYALGDNFVAYTKDMKVTVCYTDAQMTQTMTGDTTKNLLASANKNGICYYDTTDTKIADEAVIYAYMKSADDKSAAPQSEGANG